MIESESKAVKWMKSVRDHAVVTLDHIEKNEPDVSPMLYAGRKEKAETIIKGFEELEQYRSIGTVEEIKEMLTELARWRSDRLNDKIKNPFACMSTLICHNCDHKDEYIEELEAEKEELSAANMERSERYYNGGWIPCKERLPEENQRVIACFAHETVTELSFYGGMFNGIYSYNTNVIIAWQPLPQPYHEPSQADPPQSALWKEHLAQRFGRVE